MIENDHALAVALYILGPSVDPALLTSLLGMEPSSSQKLGESWTTSTNKLVTPKTGKWAKILTEKDGELPEVLDELISLCDGKEMLLAEIASQHETFIDIFLSVSANEDGGVTTELDFSSETVAGLARLSLPVKLTFVVTAP